jgi:hypothetical protein
MRWQAWGEILAAALLVLLVLEWLVLPEGRLGFARAEVGRSFISLALRALAWVFVAVLTGWGVIVLWHTYRTAKTAFGKSSAIIYVLLAVALAFFPGLFVIPHMVRLDVKRLRGVEPDEPAEPPEPFDKEDALGRWAESGPQLPDGITTARRSPDADSFRAGE